MKFIEERWNIRFKDQEQMIELLHVSFVNDGWGEVPEIDQTEFYDTSDATSAKTRELSELQLLRMNFWKNFVQYCREKRTW